MTRSLLLAAVLAAGFGTAPAFAQSADPVTAPAAAPSTGGTTDAGEIPIAADSAIDPRTWVGRPVLSADGGSVGTLRAVHSPAQNSPAATLEVERADGPPLTLPIEGASTDGKSVTVASTLAQVKAAETAK